MKNFKITIHDDVEQDILNIAEYYNKQQKGLGKKFAIELQKKFKSIQKAPYTSTIIHGDKIFPSLKKFPFYIAISVDDVNKMITVWAVLHHKQSPDKWP
jgi:plasmid stabilization system protein ParE